MMKLLQRRIALFATVFLSFLIFAFAAGMGIADGAIAQQQKPIQFLFLKCIYIRLNTSSDSKPISGGTPIYYRIPKEGQSIVYTDYFGKWDPDSRQWVSVKRFSSDTYTVAVDANNILVKSEYGYASLHSDFYQNRSYELKINRRTGSLEETSTSDAVRSTPTYRSTAGTCQAGEPIYNEVNKF